jgi:hypothetical protein
MAAATELVGVRETKLEADTPTRLIVSVVLEEVINSALAVEEVGVEEGAEDPADSGSGGVNLYCGIVPPA